MPEEIAVLGVDDMEFLTENIQVPMSSIDTRLEELGYEACKRLEELMSGKVKTPAPVLQIAPKGVVQRQSTNMLAVDHPGVQAAMNYIHARFQEAITLEDIGNHVQLSKRGLEKAFLKYMGRTPAAELRRVRLDRAKKLLTETDDKIEAIAFDCGYSNSSNLSFAFRRTTGLTPRTYRMQFRKD